MLGLLDTDDSVGLVDIDRVLEALVDFLGEADVLLGHDSRRVVLGLRSLSSALRHRTQLRLRSDLQLHRRH